MKYEEALRLIKEDEWNEGRSENFVPNSFKRSIPNYRFLPSLNPSTGKLNKEDRM